MKSSEEATEDEEQAIRECLSTGAQYDAALNEFLRYLLDVATLEDVNDEMIRVKKFIHLLDTEMRAYLRLLSGDPEQPPT
jgi:hypothetical protein